VLRLRLKVLKGSVVTTVDAWIVNTKDGVLQADGVIKNEWGADIQLFFTEEHAERVASKFEDVGAIKYKVQVPTEPFHYESNEDEIFVD
jgi:hypothetical protein